jgi:carbon monoxide dehydrogenase subunit G
MEMKGERLLPAGRMLAWALLNDSEVLKQCVPGCEILIPTGDNSYDVIVSSAIGPVKARFKGKLSLTDIEATVRYRLVFEGHSSQAGFARGQAKVELEEVTDQQTRLIYVANAQIGGKLAQIGSRLVDAAAGATADKFFEAFAAQLAARAPAPAAAVGTMEADGATEASAAPQVPIPPPRTGFWSWVVSFWRHLFAHPTRAKRPG